MLGHGFHVAAINALSRRFWTRGCKHLPAVISEVYVLVGGITGSAVCTARNSGSATTYVVYTQGIHIEDIIYHVAGEVLGDHGRLVGDNHDCVSSRRECAGRTKQCMYKGSLARGMLRSMQEGGIHLMWVSPVVP